MQMLRAARCLAGLVEEYGVEVVQSHLPQANYLLSLGGWDRSVLAVPTLHNTREFEYSRRRTGVVNRLRRRAYRRLILQRPLTIAVSRDVREQVGIDLGLTRGQRREKIAVVPNGVPLPSPVSQAERRELRRRWLDDEEAVLIASVGRLSWQKNYPGLIDALALCSTSIGKWRCVIAGEGEDFPAIKERIRERGLEPNIQTVGWLPEVRSLLGAADLFCHTARFEGMPLALLEAMSFGLPICAFDAPGVTEVLAAGQNALLAGQEEPGRFAVNVETLVGNEGLRRTLGAEGRRRMMRNWSFETMMDRLEEIYGACLHDAP